MHNIVHSSSVTPLKLTGRSILRWVLPVYYVIHIFAVDAQPLALGLGTVITTPDFLKKIKHGGYFQLRNESGSSIIIEGDFAGLYTDPLAPQTVISGIIPESARKTGAFLRITTTVNPKITERLISPVLEKKPQKLRNVFLRYSSLGTLEPEFPNSNEAALWNAAPLV